MRTPRLLVVLAGSLALAAASAVPASAGPILLGPTAYLSSADSPFASQAFAYFHLENFEDDLLNTPGVNVNHGGIASGFFVDSVEGPNPAGKSWYSVNSESIDFTFDAGTLGTLPTHVGIVWTDIGFNSPTPYFANVFFEAFDPLGLSLGVIGPYLFGEANDTGQQSEDRFFGAIYNDGISRIRLSTNNIDWEVDHLQYGAAGNDLAPVPEPSTLLLVGSGAVAALRTRSRARKQRG